MSPPLPTAKLTLTYPIFASVFDPENSDYLFVGGGGGEGNSGIKNKITLIDTSKRREISEVVDVELSASEDSVQSLAVALSQDNSAVVYAGINSSTAEQEKGKNDHLRSFKLTYPTKRSTTQESKPGATASSKATTSTIQALSKSALFKPSTAKTKETYQRILRLSRKHKTLPIWGVTATGLAPEGEVVVFEATNTRPDKRDIRQRINLGKDKEASDVDIIASSDSEYLVAYSCNNAIFLSRSPADKTVQVAEPECAYQTPMPSPTSPSRLKFRFVRFLTPKILIAVLNLPERGGSELYLMELGEDLGASVLLRKTLNKRMKAAVTFAVAPLVPSASDVDTQYIIAIGGQDISITIVTIDINPASRSTYRFKDHSVQRDLHPIQMTSLAFSEFTPPGDPIKASPQYLKLASTSMSNTVVVQTLPLIPYPSPVAKRKPTDPPVRYTLIPPKPVKGQTPLGISVIIAVVLVAVSAVLLQAMIEIRGVTPEILGAKDWLSDSLREKLAIPWMFDETSIFENPLQAVRSGASEAYEAVTDALPNGRDQIQTAAEAVTSQVEDTAAKVGRSATHHHRKIRNLLSERAEHLATSLTSADDDEDEDDEDYPHDQPPQAPQSKAIVISDIGTTEDHALSSELHHTEADLVKQGKVRKWEDLKAHEKRGWLRKLEDAGIWASEEGETVLKGIFFSELAGAVAGAIRG